MDSSTTTAVSASPASPSPVAARLRGDTLGAEPIKVLHPIAADEFRLLLLENINQRAVKSFKDHGFRVDHYTKAWSEDELVEKIGSYHAIGIRSKTKITERVLKAASKVRKAAFIIRNYSSPRLPSSLSLDAFALVLTKSTS